MKPDETPAPRPAELNDLVAYCGVDCAACPDYAAERCPGCRKSEWPDGDPCMPIACCQARGISFCGQCAGFPCADMRGFYGESDGHRAAYARMRALRGRPEA